MFIGSFFLGRALASTAKVVWNLATNHRNYLNNLIYNFNPGILLELLIFGYTGKKAYNKFKHNQLFTPKENAALLLGAFDKVTKDYAGFQWLFNGFNRDIKYDNNRNIRRPVF